MGEGDGMNQNRNDAGTRHRDRLLAFKSGQRVRELAEDIVESLVCIAIHGSTGIGADNARKEEMIRLMEHRINEVER